jgi:Antirestriction protein
MTSANHSTRITATRVTDEDWLNTVTRHFGGYQLTLEEAVHGWLQEFSEDYRGPWRTYELSNGGLYMAPVLESAQIRVAGNGYRGRLSGDAAGVLVSLFALNHLFLEFHDATLARHFAQLMELAAQHPEASAIVWATN